MKFHGRWILYVHVCQTFKLKETAKIMTEMIYKSLLVDFLTTTDYYHAYSSLTQRSHMLFSYSFACWFIYSHWYYPGAWNFVTHWIPCMLPGGLARPVLSGFRSSSSAVNQTMLLHIAYTDHVFNKGDHIDGLVQERRNSSGLAIGLRLSCTNP